MILDMVLPEMDGAECFAALRKINPRVRAILSTGSGRNEAAQKALDEGMAGFIQKPYHLGRLAEVVAQAVKK